MKKHLLVAIVASLAVIAFSTAEAGQVKVKNSCGNGIIVVLKSVRSQSPDIDTTQNVNGNTEATIPLSDGYAPKRATVYNSRWSQLNTLEMSEQNSGISCKMGPQNPFFPPQCECSVFQP